MNNFEFIDYVKVNISKKLFNKIFNINERKDNEVLFSNKQILFEQYKVLVDSAYKTEERRNASNSMFLGINTLLSSFVIRPSQLIEIKLIDLPLLLLLVLVGILICKEWLAVITSYKQLNSINFLLIQHLEKFLPAYIFSLRTEIEIQQEQLDVTNQGNVVLSKEKFLPKIFLFFYSIYAVIIIISVSVTLVFYS